MSDQPTILLLHTIAATSWADPDEIRAEIEGRVPDADVRVAYGGREGLEGAVTVETPARTVGTRLPLLGAHQARNAGVATALVEQLLDRPGLAVVSDDVPDATAALERGMRNAHWPGRFEVMGRDPLVVLDGAHDPGGCETLVEVLGGFDYDDLHVVVGAMTDKDHRCRAGHRGGGPGPRRGLRTRPRPR